MRWWVLGLVLVGCEAEPEAPAEIPCVNPELEAWCFHDPSAPAEIPDGEVCEAPTFSGGPKASQCGDWDVIGSGSELNGNNQYFHPETGELVAVAYFTDTSGFCGNHVYWYGEELHCY